MTIVRHMFVDVGFTRWNLYGLLVCACFDSGELYAVVTCLCWGILFSFHASLLFDRSSFGRIAASMDMSMSAFHVFNLLMHVLPCLVTLVAPVELRRDHGVIAATVHLAWGLLCSRGTMRLDHLYVPMRKQDWYALWLVSTVAEVVTPLVLPLISFYSLISSIPTHM